MTIKSVEFSIKNSKVNCYKFLVKNPQKTLVLIHGMGEHIGRYKRFIKKFNENDITVFAMDLRGHGYSVGPKGHCTPRSEVLSDVDQLLEKAIEYNDNIPVFIYGHSFGGNIVLDYRRRGLHRNKIDGYILSAPWVLLTRKTPWRQKVTVRLAAKLMPRKTFPTIAGADTRGATMQKAGYKKDPLSHQLISYQTAVDGFDVAESLYKGEGLEKASKAPMLLMHGTEDKMCHVDGSKKIAENEGTVCELIVWQNRGHDLHRGKTAQEGNMVVSKVIEWMNQK